ncbi:hypothetical protein SLE2022_355940 [Rubroshorea leprosula]
MSQEADAPRTCKTANPLQEHSTAISEARPPIGLLSFSVVLSESKSMDLKSYTLGEEERDWCWVCESGRDEA